MPHDYINRPPPHKGNTEQCCGNATDLSGMSSQEAAGYRGGCSPGRKGSHGTYRAADRWTASMKYTGAVPASSKGKWVNRSLRGLTFYCTLCFLQVDTMGDRKKRERDRQRRGEKG